MRLITLSALVTAISLAGCGSVYEMNNSINNSLAEMMGTYTAPTLASSPTPTPGCDDSRCKQLGKV